MAEFVKKSMMGYKEVEGGFTDPECTHAILTKEEYDSLRAEIYETKREAERKIRGAESKAFDEVRNINYARQREAAEADVTINDLKQKLTVEQEKVEFQKSLNRALLDMARSRANAKRGLVPKKEHSGYVVKRSTEQEHRFRSGGSWFTVKLWETILETPYSVDHSSEEAADLIEELFAGEHTDRQWLIAELGITHRYLTLDAFHKAWAAKSVTEDNASVEQHLSANYKSGFWEIHLLHTQSLDVVPWHWREKGDEK